MHLMAGTVLQDGKYKVDAVLGVGGFGITYRATHTHLGQSVVLKSLNDSLRQHPDFAQFQQQFVTEAQRLALCHHPNMVRVLDFVEEAELCLIVMDYIPGPTLADLVEPGKPLSEAEATHYIRQIASALRAVHQSGLLHRDVKPENIIRRSGTHLAMLVDFGIARDFTPGMRQTHSGLLSAGYAPLEQYLPDRKLTPATDIYALAATFYYLLAGEPPVAAPVRGRIPLRNLREFQPCISPEAELAILRGLELEPHRRPQSIDRWLTLLTEPATRTATASSRRPNSLQNQHWGSTALLTGRQELSPSSAGTPTEYLFEPSLPPIFPLLFLLTAAICGWMGFDLAQQYTATRTPATHFSSDRSFRSFQDWLKQELPQESSPHLLFEAPSVESSPSPPIELHKQPKGNLQNSEAPLTGESDAALTPTPEPSATAPSPSIPSPEPTETHLPTELPPEPTLSNSPEPPAQLPPEPDAPTPVPVPEVIPPPTLPTTATAKSSPAPARVQAAPPPETSPLPEPVPLPQPERDPLYSTPSNGSTQTEAPQSPVESTPASPSSELLDN